MQVLVVTNPANTNALILKDFAPSIPEKNITCLTRLDHNIALSLIAEKIKVPVSDVKNIIIWGNHYLHRYDDIRTSIMQLSPSKMKRNLLKNALVTIIGSSRYPTFLLIATFTFLNYWQTYVDKLPFFTF